MPLSAQSWKYLIFCFKNYTFLSRLTYEYQRKKTFAIKCKILWKCSVLIRTLRIFLLRKLRLRKEAKTMRSFVKKQICDKFLLFFAKFWLVLFAKQCEIFTNRILHFAVHPTLTDTFCRKSCSFKGIFCCQYKVI